MIERLEGRLALAEAQLAEEHATQLAGMKAAVEPFIQELIQARLSAFEDEVQARLLIAVAGAARERASAASAGGGGAGGHGGGHGGDLNLQLRVFGTSSSASAAVGDDGQGRIMPMHKLMQHAGEIARAEAERVVVASRGGMMTREELLHVVEHMGVVADTHASMQLAVSQLRTVCPELGRIISLLKVGRCNVNHAPPLFESKLWIMAIKCGCWVNTCWRYQVAIVWYLAVAGGSHGWRIQEHTLQAGPGSRAAGTACRDTH